MRLGWAQSTVKSIVDLDNIRDSGDILHNVIINNERWYWVVMVRWCSVTSTSWCSAWPWWTPSTSSAPSSSSASPVSITGEAALHALSKQEFEFRIFASWTCPLFSFFIDLLRSFKTLEGLLPIVKRPQLKEIWIWSHWTLQTRGLCNVLKEKPVENCRLKTGLKTQKQIWC